MATSGASHVLRRGRDRLGGQLSPFAGHCFSGSPLEAARLVNGAPSRRSPRIDGGKLKQLMVAADHAISGEASPPTFLELVAPHAVGLPKCSRTGTVQ